MEKHMYTSGFPGVSDGKESACNVGDPGLITGFGMTTPKMAFSLHPQILTLLQRYSVWE